jgi:cytidylate kinase
VNKKINIAIDGLSATGKGMTSKFLAKELNYHYLDTGAMYRGVTWDLNRRNIDPRNIDEFDLATLTIEFGDKNHLYVNGENIEHHIRVEKISKLTPEYAANRVVRFYINEQLKHIVDQKGNIAEGRDIASHVMPNAEIKLFLTGSSDIRAKRRQEQLKLKGILENVEEVRLDLEARDHADMTRDIAPLKKHGEALEIDTSNLSLNEQNEFILNLIKRYLKNNDI